MRSVCLDDTVPACAEPANSTAIAITTPTNAFIDGSSLQKREQNRYQIDAARSARTRLILNRDQGRFDRRTMRFLPRRQLQLSTELRHAFVRREAWGDRRHLEQHIARLAEVD